MASIQKDSEDTSSEYVLPELKDITNLSKNDILFSDDLYDAIFHLESESERTDYLNKLAEAADANRCLTMFKAKLKAVKSDYKKMNKTELQDAESLLPEGYFSRAATVDLDGWIVNDAGIYKFDGDKTVQACYHPIFIVRREVDCFDEKKQKVVIAWQRRGHGWKKATVPREMISSARSIVGLASYGIGVTSENAKGLVRFLSAFENKNYDLFQELKTTSKLGWKDGYFIPFEQNEKDPINLDSEKKSVAEPVGKYGDYNTWLSTVKKVRAKRRFGVLLYLASSFASVLPEKLDGLSFIVSLYGQSGRGKTLALMLACSVWANPREGEYIVGSNATQNGLEFKLDFINNLPLLVDDITTMQLNNDTPSLSAFIYKVCGNGKLRGTKDLDVASQKTWKNVTLTNAERPLVDDSFSGGSINRVLDVPIGDEALFEDGRRIAAVLKRNYGFAGELFVKALREMGNKAIAKVFEEKYAELVRLSKEINDEKEEKQLLPMAQILAADQIATDCIFKDGIYIDPKDCLPIMKSIDDVSEETRAYEQLIDVISSNIGRFITPQNKYPVNPIWGRIDDNAIVMNYVVFSDEVKKLGFNPKQLFRWLVDNKGAQEGADGRPPKNHIMENDARPRCVSFYASDVDKDGFIPAEELEKEDGLPF